MLNIHWNDGFLPPSFAQKYGQHVVISHDFPTSSHDFMALLPIPMAEDRWCGGGRNEQISFCCCSTPTSLGWGHLGDLGHLCGFCLEPWRFWIQPPKMVISWDNGDIVGSRMLSGNMNQHEPTIIRNICAAEILWISKFCTWKPHSSTISLSWKAVDPTRLHKDLPPRN